MKRILTVLALLASCLAFGLAPAHAAGTKKPEATDLEKVQAYVGPSIVNLQVKWQAYVYDNSRNKRYLGDYRTQKPQQFTLAFQCTGYVINPEGYVATAGHCVNPLEVLDDFRQAASSWAAKCGCYYNATTLSAQYIYQNFSSHWFLKNVDSDTNETLTGPQRSVSAAWSVSAGGVDVGKQVPARVVKFQKFSDGDGALLKVDQSDLPALPLTTKAPEIGKGIVAVGFPGSVDDVTDPDLEPSYKEGSIGSKSTENGGLTTVYEMSAATSGGMSGGPVVNNKGEVLGFVDFKNATETQAFNFMRPASSIFELLPSDAKNTLDANTKLYRSGLDAYFAGDKLTAVKNLKKVVAEQPTNKFASQFLAKARKLPNPPKKAGFPILPVGIGVVVLVLLAGGAAVLLTRGRKKTPGGPAAGGPEGFQGGPGPSGYSPPGAAAAAPAYAPSSAPAPAGVALADPPAPGSTHESDTSDTSGTRQAAPVAETPSAPAPLAPLGFGVSREDAAPAGAAPSVQPSGQPSVQPSGPATEETGPVSGGFCGGCGTAREAGKKFCGNCGTAY